MDIILLLKAFILGVIEGIAEFLPISSTGYLILARDSLGFLDEAKSDLFIVVIQFGAILAVIFAYFQRLWYALLFFIFGDNSTSILQNNQKFQSLARGYSKGSFRNFGFSLIIATLPILIIGFTISDVVKEWFFHKNIVAFMLILGGFLILYIEKFPPKTTIFEAEKISLKTALWVGIFQALAVIPGTSRAGASIVSGLFLGISRKAATEFSFFLGIPVLIGAALLDFAKNYSVLTANSDYLILIFGILISFITALLTIKWLISYVSKFDFKIFAYLRIVTGILVFTGIII